MNPFQKFSVSKIYKWSINNSKKTLIIGSLLTILFAGGLTKLKINTDGALLYPIGDKTVEQLKKDQAIFKDTPNLILIINSKSNKNRVASQSGFKFLRHIHKSLEKMPEVKVQSLNSLVSQIYLPEINKFHIKGFLDSIPQSAENFDKLLKDIQDFDLTQGLYLSPDGLSAAIYIPINNQDDRVSFVKYLDNWILKQDHSLYNLLLLGPAVAEAKLGITILNDFSVMIPIIAIVVFVLLLFFIRTIAGILVIFLEIGLVLIWVFGLMGYMQIPITLMTTILPVLLIIISITDEIHLLERIEKELEHNDSLLINEDYTERIKTKVLETLNSIKKPLVLTSLTTAIGFLTFMFTSSIPLRQFGLFSTLGILLAMCFTFTVIPAFLVVIPTKYHRPLFRSGYVNNLFTFKNWKVKNSYIGASILLIGTFILLPELPNLKVQDSWIDNFDSTSAIVKAETLYNKNFWGSYSCDLVIKTNDENFFYSKQGILLVEDINEVLSDAPYTGGVLSYLIPFERMAFFKRQELPLSSISKYSFNQIIQISKLVSNRIGLDNWISKNGKSIKIRLLVKDSNYARANDLMDYLNKVTSKHLKPYKNISYHFSGDLPIAISLVESITKNQLESVLWTVLVILIILTFYIDWKMAFIAICPLIFTSLIILELMSVFGISLGIATSMFATITICVGVDMALYIIIDYKKGINGTKNYAETIKSVLKINGKALAINSLVLTAGFLVLLFSSMTVVRNLGILLSLSLILSYLSIIFILPILLKVIRSKEQ